MFSPARLPSDWHDAPMPISQASLCLADDSPLVPLLVGAHGGKPQWRLASGVAVAVDRRRNGPFLPQVAKQECLSLIGRGCSNNVLKRPDGPQLVSAKCVKPAPAPAAADSPSPVQSDAFSFRAKQPEDEDSDERPPSVSTISSAMSDEDRQISVKMRKALDMLRSNSVSPIASMAGSRQCSPLLSAVTRSFANLGKGKAIARSLGMSDTRSLPAGAQGNYDFLKVDEEEEFEGESQSGGSLTTSRTRARRRRCWRC